MERLANKLSKKIAVELSFSEDKREVIEYGLFAIIQTLILVLSIVVFGYIFNVLIQSLIICFAVSILRKYSGGAHSSSMLSCTIISIFTCVGFGLIAKYLGTFIESKMLLIIICSFVFVFAFWIAFMRAPVDSPNKPISSQKRIMEMKKYTLIILFIYIIITTILLISDTDILGRFGLILSLMIAIFWQIGSITKIGKNILEKVDKFVYNIISKKGEHSNEED